MRVLIYGGCHAVILQRMLASAAQGGHEFEMMINYQLINSGTPFPFDELRRFDFVIYSPVLNKGEWNTDLLVERCRTHSIPTLSYPWLQWMGYFPTARHDELLGNRTWEYGFIRRRLQNGQRPASIVSDLELEVGTEELSAKDLGTNASAMLREYEARGRVDVSVADFIDRRYLDEQLFLTPDHPATSLYVWLVREIGDRMGITLKAAPPEWDTEQHDDSIPILQPVARALGLRFTPTETYRFPQSKGRTADLLEYISLVADELKAA